MRGVERRKGEKNVCADEITKQLKCSEDKKSVLGHGEKRKSNAEIKKFFLSHNTKSVKAVYTIIRLLGPTGRQKV